MRQEGLGKLGKKSITTSVLDLAAEFFNSYAIACQNVF
jgi:hypothetical protein